MFRSAIILPTDRPFHDAPVCKYNIFPYLYRNAVYNFSHVHRSLDCLDLLLCSSGDFQTRIWKAIARRKRYLDPVVIMWYIVAFAPALSPPTVNVQNSLNKILFNYKLGEINFFTQLM